MSFASSKSRLLRRSVAMLLSASPVLAQGTIEGKVHSTRDNSPVADATIFIEAIRRAAVTDARGQYRIPTVATGSHTVVAQRIGFARDTQVVFVAANATVTLDFALDEAATYIAPVVVSATAEVQARNEGSVTIDALGGQEVRETRAAHPAEIMNRLAGVHVSQLSGEGHSMAIRQPITTSPVYLYLEDGIPTRATGFFNHNALYEVNIPQSAGIEIIKGPGTALYGSDAIGGVVNVLTRPAPRTPSLEASVEGGAYGYRRLLLTGGNTWGAHGLRADVNVTHSDNWKEAAPFDRQSGTIRWDALIGASGWTAKTVLTGSRIDQQDVPSVSRAIFDTAMTVNLAPIAFRRVRALRLSAAFEKQSGASHWSFTPYGRINEMGLLPSWQLSFDPQVWDTKNTSAGLLARWRRDVTPLNGQVIVGADVDWSPGSFEANQAVVTRTGPYNAWTSYTEGEAHYDYDVTYRSASPYIQTLWRPTERLNVDVGLRGDFSGYDYTTNLAPLETGAHRRPASTRVSYAHLSPKVGVNYSFSRALGVYGSYRHGFRAPSQGQLFQQNSAANTVDLDPVKVDSYEAGVRGQVGDRFVYQVSAYDMFVTDDILTFVTPQNTREATNAGRTRHRGIESSTGAALTRSLRLDVAYSVASHRYVEWNPSTTSSFSGKLMAQAPRDMASTLLTWSAPALNGGRLAFEWSHTGKYAGDPSNAYFYGGYELLNLHGNVILGGHRRAELFFRAINLADRQFAELVSFDQFQRDQYTPGAPRSLFVGARYGF